MLLARLDGASGVAWYLTDEAGSVHEIVDTNGSVLDRLTYGPFGELLSETNPTNGDRFKYASGAYDAATGLTQFGLRYYDPNQGRWLSEDPGGYAMGDSNLYRYVGNNPMNAIDPTGLKFQATGPNGELPPPPTQSGTGTIPVSGGSDDGYWWGGGNNPFNWLGQGTELAANNYYGNTTEIADAAHYLTVTAGDQLNVVLGPPGGTLDRVVNATDSYSAGLANTVTLGLTGRVRASVYGEIATRNESGAFYTAGQVTGFGIGMTLGFANPCNYGATIGAGMRAVAGMQAVGGSLNAAEKLQKKEYFGAAIDAVGVLASFAQYFKPCFAAGTPLRTPNGSKPIEEFQAGDLIVSRCEDDPSAPVVVRRVEEVFANHAFIRLLRVEGRDIRTTAEHPFWVENKGWTAAQEIQAGDRVASESLGWLTVDEARDTGEFVAVYNLRVEADHTYFVGGLAWGFAVWSHNADCSDQLGLTINGMRAMLRSELVTGYSKLIAHHLIPLEALTKFPQLMLRAAKGGFSLNGGNNGALVRAAEHVGGHPGYNKVVIDHIRDNLRRFRVMTDEDVATWFQNVSNTLRSALDADTFGPWF